MKIKRKQRQAVVIIHGIGNQMPMETTREFVENIKDNSDILYSSPDREANFFETRRLSLSRKKTDFYEFYWANLVNEPSSSDLREWISVILFKKEPSVRAKKLVVKIRIAIVALVLLFSFFLVTDILKSCKNGGFSAWNTGTFTIGTFLVIRFLLPRINIKAAQTVGDAVKYLTPSPQNIDSRFKIRQKGVSLLKKLHEKRDRSGNLIYSRIIIVGHSLGSVVGYDIITNLWHDYIYSYVPGKAPVLQPILDEMSTLIVDHHKNKNEFPLEAYNQLQQKLYDEIKSLGNPWLISDFITVGSPLCHGAYIMAKDKGDFERRTNYRELPLNPPKIEVKLKDGNIVKDYKNAISYEDKVNNKKGDDVVVKIINHSSQFSFIRWRNIFFNNDYVGGDLKEYFGEGIKNDMIIPKGSFMKRNLPCYSHTYYWDKDQVETIALFRELLFGNE
ncbi:hypothetical protein EZL74_11130 [Flavobacterium silvisoli]|uniref:DUF676 domain-containing protein n=1 Tax=Flavobacterium silvisoli TaxID=2529433 RepID=A0A4Q9YRT4_9FLAO|nr:hypothetical protein [Flavobacterium silvisoli]TBX66133.1 hypothetical protein EZL74_11130 [Flavobacterium silvisoli]